MTDRRGLLRAGTLALATLAAAGGGSAPVRAVPPGRAVVPQRRATAATPEEALTRLKAGNAGWVGNRTSRPDASPARRRDLATHQEPFAVVFSCIDSRVPPELVFDQGLGDLMVVRTAAHTHDALVAGSLEYGPVELDAKLVVVLGHQRCGAVTAAVQSFRDGEPLPGHLEDVVRDLRAPYEEAGGEGVEPAQLIDATIRAQTRRTVARLRADRILRPLVEAGRLGLVGAYYSLDTGEVAFSN